ncbi:MAG: epimerase [Anaerolineae bacterium UTCFX1]|jgi:dTDP-glucose 4,6-dehydratase|nr:MAG: epimerase [Anaerolineae bacterium UTCFX1]
MNRNLLAADLDHILNHTRDLWDELRGERIFISGGTGFFGCWLLESFIWANEKLKLNASATALTRSPSAFQKKAPHLARNKAVVLIEGDVRNFDFPVGAFSHIVHAATESSAKLNDENPLLMLDTIVAGTRHMLDFAAQCNARKFLLTSSGAVYGKQPSELTHIPEDYIGAPDPLDIKSAYGQGKRVAEHLCALYGERSNIEMKIARCFAFVGPYLPLDIHFAIGNFIRDAMRGERIVVKGDGTPYRSYLYAADLAIWLWTILLRGQAGRAYNVGSEEEISIAETANSAARSVSPNVAVEIRGKPNPAATERYVPSTEKARAELGLEQYISLEDSIKRTISFYQGLVV